MKKLLSLLLILLMGIGLGACAKNSSNNKSHIKTRSSVKSSVKKSTSSIAEAPTEPEPVEQTALWNPNKTAQLRALMDEYQKNHNQFDAADYATGVAVKLYGIEFPKALIEKQFRTELNGKDLRVSWSTDGISGDGYNIVGVYSDDAHAKSDPHTLYLFTIINRQPAILVTSQKDQNDRHAIVFTRVTDEQLNSGFQAIVNGN